MKIINPYSFGVPLPSPNTFIGGVGATSVTSIADFIALTGGITAANIFNFQIDSLNNVSFFCDASYTLDVDAFNADAALTYYIDEKCTQINSGCFKATAQINYYFYFPAVTITGNQIWQQKNDINVISIPLCTPIGGSVGSDGCFASALELQYVITHADNETNNSSNPDGDLTSGVDIQNIRYVTNTTPPGNISDLTVDAVFGTAFNVSWSAPSTTNAIIYYEVWANNRFIGLQTSTSKLITGLSFNTSYKIKVRTLDEFGNRGESNIVNQTTDASEAIPISNIISYWNLNSNSNDSVGTNNGTDTSISYATNGIVGKAADFSAGITSKIVLADDDTLSFTDGNDLPFSIGFWVYINVTGDQMLISKLAVGREWYVFYVGQKMKFYLEYTSGNSITISTTATIPTGEWVRVDVTNDGSEAVGGMSIYINALLADVTDNSAGTYLGMGNTFDVVVIGQHGNQTDILSLDGLMDELSIFDIELSAAQVTAIKVKNDAGNGLID